MSASLRQRTALTSLLIMVALLGHSLFHALDVHHHHGGTHHHHHHHHDHDHYADHHDSLDDTQDTEENNSKIAVDIREVLKGGELFSLIPVAPQTDLTLERLATATLFPEGRLWNGIAVHLVPNSRAPPASAVA